MSIYEKSSSYYTQEMDPLLKDLSEKKKNFRQSVVSLASELKDVRSRLASKEECIAQESLTRQAAEMRAKSMEEEIQNLRKNLEGTNVELQACASSAEQYLKELDDLRSQLSTTQEVANSNAASAHSAQLQCLELLNELDKKNSLLEEHADRVNKLEMQLGLLQKELQMREDSQKNLKDGILKIEHEIMQASVKARASKDCQRWKILDEISPKCLNSFIKRLTSKDEEIDKLRKEIRTTSEDWIMKTQELESQLEKQRRIDQELKKMTVKLEFCLQEARSQMRKLQKVVEKKEQALTELRKQLTAKKLGEGTDKENFWESSNFKIVVFMSMVILVVFANR